MRRSSSSGVGGGGCCTTRYSTTPYIPYYTNDVSKMDRIMLRFRPIAPKPATSGPTSTSSSSGSTSPKKRKSPNKTTKPNNNNNNNNTRKKSRSPSNTDVVTLSLLPETPDLTRNNNNNDNNGNNGNMKSSKEPTWLNFGLTALEVIPSTVTVEKVSATWQDECTTDEERKRRLEEDTCPGFISDGWNRVWWTNEEYRKMVTGGDKGDTWRKERLVSVKMEMREKVENIYGGGFTCRVRVQYGNSRITVPCDVWRMNSGGFAWRLDVKAALTLAL